MVTFALSLAPLSTATPKRDGSRNKKWNAHLIWGNSSLRTGDGRTRKENQALSKCRKINFDDHREMACHKDHGHRHPCNPSSCCCSTNQNDMHLIQCSTEDGMGGPLEETRNTRIKVVPIPERDKRRWRRLKKRIQLQNCIPWNFMRSQFLEDGMPT